jgi:hypothetical protein
MQTLPQRNCDSEGVTTATHRFVNGAMPAMKSKKLIIVLLGCTIAGVSLGAACFVFWRSPAIVVVNRSGVDVRNVVVGVEYNRKEMERTVALLPADHRIVVRQRTSDLYGTHLRFSLNDRLFDVRIGSVATPHEVFEISITATGEIDSDYRGFEWADLLGD